MLREKLGEINEYIQNFSQELFQKIHSLATTDKALRHKELITIVMKIVSVSKAYRTPQILLSSVVLKLLLQNLLDRSYKQKVE